jgi:hypothetical protein
VSLTSSRSPLLTLAFFALAATSFCFLSATSCFLELSFWSIVYLPTNGAIYLRTAAMAKVKTVSLGAFSFACGARKILDIDTDATGDARAMFVDYTGSYRWVKPIFDEQSANT